MDLRLGLSDSADDAVEDSEILFRDETRQETLITSCFQRKHAHDTAAHLLFSKVSCETGKSRRKKKQESHL